MAEPTIHQCECEDCHKTKAHPDQELHRNMNLLFSRLDAQQRRWYAAVEAQRAGQEGTRLMSLIWG